MILPGPQSIIDTYMDYMPPSKRQDAWQELFATYLDLNKPLTDDEADELADAITEKVNEALGI